MKKVKVSFNRGTLPERDSVVECWLLDGRKRICKYHGVAGHLMFEDVLSKSRYIVEKAGETNVFTDDLVYAWKYIESHVLPFINKCLSKEIMS